MITVTADHERSPCSVTSESQGTRQHASPEAKVLFAAARGLAEGEELGSNILHLETPIARPHKSRLMGRAMSAFLTRGQVGRTSISPPYATTGLARTKPSKRVQHADGLSSYSHSGDRHKSYPHCAIAVQPHRKFWALSLLLELENYTCLGFRGYYPDASLAGDADADFDFIKRHFAERLFCEIGHHSADLTSHRLPTL
jgi:hypothetical protein